MNEFDRSFRCVYEFTAPLKTYNVGCKHSPVFGKKMPLLKRSTIVIKLAPAPFMAAAITTIT